MVKSVEVGDRVFEVPSCCAFDEINHSLDFLEFYLIFVCTCVIGIYWAAIFFAALLLIHQGIEMSNPVFD